MNILFKKIAGTAHYFLRNTFIIMGICFLLLIIVEDLYTGFFSFWFDIRGLTIGVIASGVLALFTSRFVNQS
ncbi:MAG: hypothetical protein PHG83_04480 [Patescibacteria group bacterium]|nr:hypothetical protein [Patescibacteria group bacterium]